MVKRFTTSSSHDHTITQRVRTALYDAGHADLVNETIIDGLRDMEQMARSGLSDHEKRLAMLEEAQRARLTDSGVWKIVKGRLEAQTVDWVKWATRAAVAGIGGTLLAVVGRLAWKGLHV